MAGKWKPFCGLMGMVVERGATKTPQWLGFHQGVNRMNTERRSWDREEVCRFPGQMKTIFPDLSGFFPKRHQWLYRVMDAE